jgi:hypothetical protein
LLSYTSSKYWKSYTPPAARIRVNYRKTQASYFSIGAETLDIFI